jgi:hypothetical protein
MTKKKKANWGPRLTPEGLLRMRTNNNGCVREGELMAFSAEGY